MDHVAREYSVELRNADEPAVHRDREASVIVVEHAVHGQAVRTGRPYDNHFVSVITIKDHKVTHYRRARIEAAHSVSAFAALVIGRRKKMWPTSDRTPQPRSRYRTGCAPAQLRGDPAAHAQDRRVAGERLPLYT
jgi:hypothetical protein